MSITNVMSITKLYLDDRRVLEFNVADPLNWVLVRDAETFKSTIENWKSIYGTDLPEVISLDNDLTDEHYRDLFSEANWPHRRTTDMKLNYDSYTTQCGKQLLDWLIEYCKTNKLELPQQICIHSLNPRARLDMMSTMDTLAQQLGGNIIEPDNIKDNEAKTSELTPESVDVTAGAPDDDIPFQIE